MSSFHDIAIGELLPQQPPFRFVDHIELYSEGETRVGFTPGNGNLLMEDGCLSAAGLVEHMAQASATRVGYHSKYILHIPVSIGYIGQVRKLEIRRLPKAGELLDTSVYLRQEVFNISLADIEVRTAQGEVLATASLKTALKDD
ncbi:MAG: pseudouridylate synthase [Bacteroidales bacterium]|nr:pseudouridylate synthase [Bacteroidales bacterium]